MRHARQTRQALHFRTRQAGDLPYYLALVFFFNQGIIDNNHRTFNPDPLATSPNAMGGGMRTMADKHAIMESTAAGATKAPG